MLALLSSDSEAADMDVEYDLEVAGSQLTRANKTPQMMMNRKMATLMCR